MLTGFFTQLRRADIPVSITELLSLLEALQVHVAALSADDFYYLARAALVKDERHYDRFDQVFSAHFQGMTELFEEVFGEIPADWLIKQAKLLLSDEEKAKIEAMGGWQALMDALRKRLAEQEEAHHGGNKMIGTGGRSPFGAYGYNPEGIRIGQDESRHQRAVKVWDRREYRNFDDQIEVGTRNMKLALRRLRKMARTGAEDELDLPRTIESTARNAGLLDIKMTAQRHNTVKVLLFLDAGGSMDYHVRVCEELFSAARAEFKHLEYYYFHNCPYEKVWRDNRRRHDVVTTWDVMHTYPHDYKLIFVGDATMSPYEILETGASVEHWNEEAGAVWMQRLVRCYPRAVWLNPTPEDYWQHTPSIKVMRELLSERMYPLTLAGLDEGIKALKHPI
jgi:uncharacterized protein with von Willebrand factor type A (vWA) domain